MEVRSDGRTRLRFVTIEKPDSLRLPLRFFHRNRCWAIDPTFGFNDKPVSLFISADQVRSLASLQSWPKASFEDTHMLEPWGIEKRLSA